MGYWAGRDLRRFYVEGNRVYPHPGGKPLALDPVTLEPTQGVPPEVETSAPAVVPAQSIKEPANVLSDFTDENKVDQFAKEGKNLKRAEHAKHCESLARRGDYTEGCPRCDQLRNK